MINWNWKFIYFFRFYCSPPHQKCSKRKRHPDYNANYKYVIEESTQPSENQNLENLDIAFGPIHNDGDFFVPHSINFPETQAVEAHPKLLALMGKCKEISEEIIEINRVLVVSQMEDFDDFWNVENLIIGLVDDFNNDVNSLYKEIPRSTPENDRCWIETRSNVKKKLNRLTERFREKWIQEVHSKHDEAATVLLRLSNMEEIDTGSEVPRKSQKKQQNG